MWLLLRSASTRSALFLHERVRVWQDGSDRRVSIDFSDGQLVLDFDSGSLAIHAASSILDALRDQASALDTEQAGWGNFLVNWVWYEPHGTPHFPDRKEPDDEELDTEAYDRKIDLAEEWGYTPPDDPDLRDLRERWRSRGWTSRQFRDTDTFILTACSDRYLSILEIASLVGRSPDGVRVHHVNPLVQSGKLIKEYPGRRHPKQRFTTNKEEFRPEDLGPEDEEASGTKRRRRRLVR